MCQVFCKLPPKKLTNPKEIPALLRKIHVRTPAPKRAWATEHAKRLPHSLYAAAEAHLFLFILLPLYFLCCYLKNCPSFLWDPAHWERNIPCPCIPESPASYDVPVKLSSPGRSFYDPASVSPLNYESIWSSSAQVYCNPGRVQWKAPFRHFQELLYNDGTYGSNRRKSSVISIRHTLCTLPVIFTRHSSSIWIQSLPPGMCTITSESIIPSRYAAPAAAQLLVPDARV